MRKPNKIKNYRRCISCQKIDHKSNFFRVVKNNAQQIITVDQGMGRSAYICKNVDCIAIAEKKRLAKALKTSIPSDIYQQLWQKLKETKNTVK